MKHKWLLGLILMLFAFNGCVALILGGGAVGGYAVSKDSIEGTVDGRQDRVFRAAVDSIKSKGLIIATNEGLGEINASVAGVKVTIKLEQITERAVKLRVKARKGLLPKIKVAQDVYTEIIKRSR